MKYSNKEKDLIVSGRFYDYNGYTDKYLTIFNDFNCYSRHFTYVFNVFVMMQFFNLFRSRKLKYILYLKNNFINIYQLINLFFFILNSKIILYIIIKNYFLYKI